MTSCRMPRLHAPLQIVAPLLIALFCASIVPSAAAVTPESPEVKALIEKALSFLAKETHEKVGGKCLIALAFKKNGRDANFGKIKEAVAACQAHPFAAPVQCDNYNLALMIIFLCETEDEAHRPQIQRMLAELLKRQLPIGAWTYDGSPLGDTSQTQYGVLAMWIADRHGYDVPLPHITNAMNWLIRTQDPTGAWGYHANLPTGSQRAAQLPLTLSLSSAAAGSLYILKELVLLPGENPKGTAGGAKDPPPKKTPGALQAVGGEKKTGPSVTRRRPIQGVDTAALNNVLRDGNGWIEKNFTVEPPAEWKHYAFYAYERYASFREVLEDNAVEEPKWFNDIFENLKKTVKPDGSWDGGDTPVAATAFSVLVLSRSTKKAIKRAEALGEGILLGGMGLPPDVKDLKERNGKLVSAPLTGNIDDLLSILDDPDNADVRAMADDKSVIALDADLSRRTGQITKLRAMVSHESYETRIVAVRSIAKVRDLDNVPVLLYALSDPDVRVIREADRGLRFISRKLQGVVELDTPTKEKLATLRSRWREWYVAIKPDAELLD
ncbi:hypothetical protein [Anatilimnocola floriformis]|uniref:hypothetical protein n=1 Tax=Anatilimnocola floriformis TaxID=2948575 RepID=UPI0020C24CC9|nr:hypothetical protein [Anatilimnocola floriformis]